MEAHKAVYEQFNSNADYFHKKQKESDEIAAAKNAKIPKITAVNLLNFYQRVEANFTANATRHDAKAVGELLTLFTTEQLITKIKAKYADDSPVLEWEDPPPEVEPTPVPTPAPTKAKKSGYSEGCNNYDTCTECLENQCAWCATKKW